MASPLRRFPEWFPRRPWSESALRPVRELLRGLSLNTVCQSAQCPNQSECFARGTATFLILGDTCTRSCRFCAVGQGTPVPPDPDEPRRVAEAAARLGLQHVVVTSVTRDDLADGGSGHFAATIEAIRAACSATVEVLTPDFQGDRDCLRRVLEARPDVYNHNIETVPRLYPRVRPQAVYERSLELLARVADHGQGILPKSGLMVGLGETHNEMAAVIWDLRRAGCEALTIGQYLRPSPEHLPVERFVPPEEFDAYREEAEAMGFSAVAAGAFVRSSYHADAMLTEIGQSGDGTRTNG
ncbi:MAG TPA: lipoyl synthase [Planctomycetota bacterium]|nr:lipoyl synthase [Planctomycetota bacterium]